MYNIIKKYVKEHSETDDIHGFPHVQRVHDLCVKIGKELNANLKILRIAAYLHDIGRTHERIGPERRNHAEISATIAKKYLLSLIYIDQDELNQIVHCIQTHSYSNRMKPITLEAKILSDVDKLDAIGAIGLYRTIGFTIKLDGGIEQVIKHLDEKILHLHENLYLDNSKHIAEKRREIIKQFYLELKEEM